MPNTSHTTPSSKGCTPSRRIAATFLSMRPVCTHSGRNLKVYGGPATVRSVTGARCLPHERTHRSPHRPGPLPPPRGPGARGAGPRTPDRPPTARGSDPDRPVSDRPDSEVLVQVHGALHRDLVRRRPALEEVGQLLNALQLHEGERVLRAVHRGEAEAAQPLVGHALQVLAHRVGVHARQT